jgi:ABC-type sugar transport system ATPase subunit
VTQTQSAAQIAAVGVSKRFGGVAALTKVDLHVEPGSCHAVIGENGAGKSTLMRILCGELTPDEGQVVVRGVAVADAGVHSARAAGIAMVHQELSLVPDMSVAENISLGAPPTALGFVRSRAQRQLARDALARVGVGIDVDELVSRLPLAARQFVEIAKALRREPSVLIVDEPTAALTPRETDRLHDLLRELQRQGMAIVYISHRLREVFSLCSQATVLRDGQRMGQLAIADTTPDELIGLMVGRELAEEDEAQRDVAPGEPVLRATDVHARGVHGVSLEARASEIVGVGGLVGAGRSELVRAIIGVDRRERGDVVVRRADRWLRIDSYRAAIRHGIAFVPEDRRGEGVALDMSVAENLSLPSVAELSRFGVERRPERQRLVSGVIDALAIRTDSPDRLVGELSGGNQQKVAVGRWLPKTPSVVVLDEPTRGVDVGAKAEIHRQIRAIADGGAAVILVSSDLPELLALSDRILVLSEGRAAGWLDGAEATSESVMRLATSKREELTVGA